ncbi:MAG: hypothetical protein GY789_20645 [Hyphomicrobiales bacterium]|nr:hypothetical protein [Hyphomicrobiales bacterium]
MSAIVLSIFLLFFYTVVSIFLLSRSNVFDGEEKHTYNSLMKDRSIVMGYGFRRKRKRLVDAGATRVLIDTEDDREYFHDMRRAMGIALRPGDTLLLVSISDLGPRPMRLLKCLADWDVKVQIVGHEPVLCDTKEKRDQLVETKANAPYRESKRKRGRPRHFDPTPEQAKMVRLVWNAEGVTRAHRLKQVEEIMGMKPGTLVFWLVRDWIAKDRQ